MRALIFLLLIGFSAVCFGQEEQVYMKLYNAEGKMIAGNVTIQRFEGAIQALTLSSSGDHNTELTFTMPVSGASARLKGMQANREELLTGTISAMRVNEQNGTLQPNYIIKMEKVTIITCTDSKGSGGSTVTNVVLKATRIGWTYYTSDRSGKSVISQKYGWDSSTGQSWNNF